MIDLDDPVDPVLQILVGDCRETLKGLPANSVQCCVTSPPYYGLRDYGHAGQIGLEVTPAAYVAQTVSVFDEVRRVLADDGTLWLNLGDTYAANRGGTTPPSQTLAGGISGNGDSDTKRGQKQGYNPSRDPKAHGLKHKDLIGIPWRVAFALQEAGWYLRQDIIWAKPNPMPESVTDRCTRSHEYIFMFSKKPKYYYDQAAIKEPRSMSSVKRLSQDVDNQTRSTRANGGAKTNGNMKAVGERPDKQRGCSRRHAGFNDRWDSMEREEQCSGMRNKRDVWTVAPANFKGAHFATFPPKLIEPCILAGCPEGGIVLDPFGGSGTTGHVALQHRRSAILCELNPDYVAMIRQRCGKESHE